MAVETWIKKTPLGHLVPVNEQSSLDIAEIPEGEWLSVKITLKRNVKFHKKWMALLQAVFPHQDMYPTFNLFRIAIKQALGLGEWHELKDGRRVFEPGSIAFHKMDNDEFEQFYKRGLNLIVMRILPAVDCEDLNREVDDILAGRKAA